MSVKYKLGKMLLSSIKAFRWSNGVSLTISLLMLLIFTPRKGLSVVVCSILHICQKVVENVGTSGIQRERFPG